MSFRDPPSWRVSDPLNGRERSPLRIYAWPQIFAERFCEVAVREAVSASPARIRLPSSNHRSPRSEGPRNRSIGIDWNGETVRFNEASPSSPSLRMQNAEEKP